MLQNLLSTRYRVNTGPTSIPILSTHMQEKSNNSTRCSAFPLPWSVTASVVSRTCVTLTAALNTAESHDNARYQYWCLLSVFVSIRLPLVKMMCRKWWMLITLEAYRPPLALQKGQLAAVASWFRHNQEEGERQWNPTQSWDRHASSQTDFQ